MYFLYHLFNKTKLLDQCLSQVALVVKNPPATVGDARDKGSIPGPGRSPGEGDGNLLQYFCLENSMGRGTWQALPWGHKRLDMTEHTHTHVQKKYFFSVVYLAFPSKLLTWNGKCWSGDLAAHALLYFLPWVKSLTHSVHNIFSLVQLCSTLCDLMDCSMTGFPVHHNSQRLLKFMSIHLVMPSNNLILLLLLTLIFPNIRVFSNESVLCIRWPKHWSFSFGIYPSKEYWGLLFFSTCLISCSPKDS